MPGRPPSEPSSVPPPIRIARDALALARPILSSPVPSSHSTSQRTAPADRTQAASSVGVDPRLASPPPMPSLPFLASCAAVVVLARAVFLVRRLLVNTKVRLVSSRRPPLRRRLRSRMSSPQLLALPSARRPHAVPHGAAHLLRPAHPLEAVRPAHAVPEPAGPNRLDDALHPFVPLGSALSDLRPTRYPCGSCALTPDRALDTTAGYAELGATIMKTCTLTTGKSTLWVAEPRAVKVVSIDRRCARLLSVCSSDRAIVAARAPHWRPTSLTSAPALLPVAPLPGRGRSRPRCTRSVLGSSGDCRAQAPLSSADTSSTRAVLTVRPLPSPRASDPRHVRQESRDDRGRRVEGPSARRRAVLHRGADPDARRPCCPPGRLLADARSSRRLRSRRSTPACSTRRRRSSASCSRARAGMPSPRARSSTCPTWSSSRCGSRSSSSVRARAPALPGPGLPCR